MKKLALGLFILVSGAVFVFLINNKFNIEQKYVPRISEETVYEQTVAGAAQWLSDRRRNLETGKVDIKDIERARKQIAELRGQKGGLNLQWKYMGPDNIGGRCRAILIDPENPNTMYAGGVSGGLWKSTTAGGSWKQIIYEGDEETNGIPNLNVSSICRAANGDIYFGTGEGFYIGYGTGSRGFNGAGIWKSTDGEHFERLLSTWSTSDSKITFSFVNKLAAHPTNPNKIFAATYRGLRVTSNGGETWENPVKTIAGAPALGFADDVKICSQGNIIITRINGITYASKNGGAEDTWNQVSGNQEHQIPNHPTAARIEFAIAPTNSNYIYAQVSKPNGQLLNVYRSKNAGDTWEIIGPGGSSEFNPLGDQGTFNNTIKVFPDNHNEIILGGQYSLWWWAQGETWETRTFWNFPRTHLLYVHADQHELRFHPNNPDIIYVGSDGGVSRSLDRGITWQTRNKFFGITQFYHIGYGPKGSIIGGTQDNGTLYYDIFKTPTQGTNYEYKEITGGDGGYSEISQLNPDFLFSTVYYGSLYRSDKRGEEQSVSMYPPESKIINDVSPGDRNQGHPFITPIALWESFYDENSIDTIEWTPTFEIEAGTTINIESKVSGLFYEYTTEENITPVCTIRIQDTYQSTLAVGFGGSVWISPNSMDLSALEGAEWFPVLKYSPNSASSYESTQHLHWSNDGNILYVAANIISNNALVGSALYRIKGFNEYRTNRERDFDREETYSLEHARIARFNNRIITGIAVDPEFGGNVIVTLGNYGRSNFVYHSTSANVDPHITSGIGNFVNKQGNLPPMPVYDALILWNDSRRVIVGTEFGVYSTNDITAANPIWYDENKGFDYVATYSLRQQTHKNKWISELSRDSGVRNHGHIWAGTHGRGIFRTTQFAGPVYIEPISKDIADVSNISIFPNPATDITNFVIELKENTDVEIQLFDLQGRMIKTFKYNNLPKGKTTKQFNCSDLRAGIYIINMRANNETYNTRLIVQ